MDKISKDSFSISSFKPKKKLGQNFLFDKNILGKMAACLDLGPNDTVLEIGSGLGTLTDFLLRFGSKVIAVEVDRDAVGLLREKFRSQNNIEIVHQDFLRYDFSKTPGNKDKIKVVGNIPYYITSAIIEHLFRFRARIKSIFLTVQKEVAERIVAAPGGREYSSLSCFTQYYTKPKIMFKIKPESFWPKPKVESVFLRLEILDTPSVYVKDEELFFRIIRLAFNQRRKIFVNTLADIYPKDMLFAVLKELGFDSKVRVEELSLADLAGIANELVKWP